MNASQQIDTQIAGYGDWRSEKLTSLRTIIKSFTELDEVVKWGTAVYTHNGLVCAISGFKNHVKINFFNGASFADPDKVFNAGLESKKSRSIDFGEKDSIDESAIKSLIQEAIEFNTLKK